MGNSTKDLWSVEEFSLQLRVAHNPESEIAWLSYVLVDREF